MNFEYFEKTSTNIEEKLIKEQGHDVCRQIISKHYINLQTKDYDFGFLHTTNVAQIGQTRSRKTSSTTRLTSFILCKMHPEFEEIDISLICSRPNSKDGKKLIEFVSQKAKEMKVKYLSLLFVGDVKFVAWYIMRGFVVLSAKKCSNGEFNVYSMKKRL